MSTFGKIDEFQVNDDWSQYIERLGHYFTANDISDTVKQKSILLSVVGAETYKLIHNLSVPNLPGTKTYEELVELVKDYLCPQPNIIVQRCLFNSRTRQPEESVATFVNELRGIASKCEYGLQLNDNLRDRLVAGVNNDRIQQRLLQNPGLTFQTALTTCLAMETAAKNVQDLSHIAQSSNLHRLQTNTKNYEGDNTKTTCYRCGRKHSPDVCWFKNATCDLCGKTGHIKPVCRSSNQPQSEMFMRDHDRKWRPGNGRNMTSQSKTHFLQEGDDEQCYSLYTIDSRYERKENRIIESFTIQDQVIDLELDTGASMSVINENTYNQLKNNAVLKKTQMILRTYSGEKIIPIGMIDVSVIYQNREHKLPLVVVQGGPNLLGRNWLREIRLNWRDIQAKLHNVSSTQSPLNDVLHRYEHPGEWPERPWSRIHIDHAGPYHNQLWLIIVDAHSKWLDIYPVSSTNSQTTIDMLRVSFSTHGLPEMIVSNNAASFTSAQFAEFCDKNRIHHVTSAPYHSASNELVERAVQSFKRGFDRMGGGSSKTKLARFLLQYRNAPQGTTGQSPAELLMGRRLRSHPDLVHPNLSQRVQRRQRCQKEQHDQHARERSIEIGDRVNSRNFSGKPVWLSGVVTEISDDNNCVISRHQDHVRGKTDVSNPPDIEQCAVRPRASL